MEVALENVYTLIHEKKISSKNNLLPLLEQITKSSCLTVPTRGGRLARCLSISEKRGRRTASLTSSRRRKESRSGPSSDVPRLGTSILTGTECSNVFNQITNLRFRQPRVQESMWIGLMSLPLSGRSVEVVIAHLLYSL